LRRGAAVPVSVAEHGTGQPFLLLHGGGGPTVVGAFGQAFAATKGVRAVVPTHPDFGGTDRPTSLGSIRGLAQLYVSLVGLLDLADVTVIGNSLGGWIGAEIGLIAAPTVSDAILIDAVGIKVPERPIADFFTPTKTQVQDLNFHDGPYGLVLGT
jgi:pimeloyl-ACP methyl ester carboxylesterase